MSPARSAFRCSSSSSGDRRAGPPTRGCSRSSRCSSSTARRSGRGGGMRRCRASGSRTGTRRAARLAATCASTWRRSSSRRGCSRSSEGCARAFPRPRPHGLEHGAAQRLGLRAPGRGAAPARPLELLRPRRRRRADAPLGPVGSGYETPGAAGSPAVGDAGGALEPFELHEHFALFSPAVSWHDVERLATASRLPVVVKGVLTAEDARLACEHGAAAVVVSNHGGRQLDGVPATLDALPEVAEAVGGRIEVYLDGGIRRGTDAVKALALGARAVLSGRAVVWGLTAGGEEGARRVLELLRELEAFVEGEPIRLAAPKPRALLALLLLNRNRVVPTERLIDELWGDDPPARATKTLQVYVSQLRKALGPERLVTQAPGYELRVEEGELDVERFESLAA